MPEIFPLPYFLVFCGYTLILIIDKVMFDTTALFTKPADGEDGQFADPVENNLKRSIRASMKGERPEMDEEGRSKSTDEQIASNVKEYLNTSDRFAQRMRASMKGSRTKSDPTDVSED